MLSVRHVTKKYGNFTALSDVSLEFGNGVYALLAPNGAGKTTLMKMMATLLFPTEGEILWDGTEINRLGAKYREILGYLPQQFGYYKSYSPKSYLMYLAALKGMDKKTAKAKIDEVLKMVALENDAKKRMRKFSGGMLQRIMIGIATAMEPALLVADEPTTAIDAITQFEILDELVRIKKEAQTAMIFISHDLNAISRVADRIVVLNQGLVVDRGDFEHILHHASDPYTKLLVEKRADVMRRYCHVLQGKERNYA